ncbi:MAG: M20/M25/M40 family metallo-hydrolase [Clostridia bacterium]|nr:M20/M25/M40 family metallo-hydrolase [Clostridia bacterium]
MELLNRICEIGGLSGFEYKGNGELKKIFEEYLEDVFVDPIGNVYGYVRSGKKDAPVIMLEAHFDTIGLMVKTIEKGGFLRVVSLGGVDSRILPGSEVVIDGEKEIFGIIGVKPPHILSAEEKEKGIKLEDILVDTGYTDKELEKLVCVGDPIRIKTKHTTLGEDKFCGGGLDDRAGIYAVLNAAIAAKNEKLEFDICVVAATTEEVSRMGALCAASRINPDVAVIVDVTHGTTPDGDKLRSSELGKGAVIALGPNLDREKTEALIKVLKEKEVPYQLEVEGGDTGTDAWVVQTVNEGVPCILVSIPLRYMHTLVEVLSLKDLENTSRIIFEFIKMYGGAK